MAGTGRNKGITVRVLYGFAIMLVRRLACRALGVERTRQRRWEADAVLPRLAPPFHELNPSG
jgi:hypothetical protein